MNQSPVETPSTLLTELDEGELYVYRKGHLEHVERDQEEGMRRVRITEEAYQQALAIGKTMRQQLRGYKPDVSLIVSAIILYGTCNVEEVHQYVRKPARSVMPR
ncbi:MAG: hypothetical protein U1F76_28820 [Candidatus Competibacteraceae bacterium]